MHHIVELRKCLEALHFIEKRIKDLQLSILSEIRDDSDTETKLSKTGCQSVFSSDVTKDPDMCIFCGKHLINCQCTPVSHPSAISERHQHYDPMKPIIGFKPLPFLNRHPH